jgi:anti-anti-sigma factor
VTEGADVRVEERTGVVIAHIAGEVDLSNADRLGQKIARAVPNSALGVVIDLSETSYLDSSGISIVFQLVERLNGRQQLVRVAVPEDAPLRRVLSVVSMESVVPITATAEAAEEEIRQAA